MLKSLYLCRIYQVTLQSTNWSVWCQMAFDEIANLEITTYLGSQMIRGFNQDFQELELLPNPRESVKGFLGCNLFVIFPEACTMLLRCAKMNLETLNSETA
jgi:hypothetical protein